METICMLSNHHVHLKESDVESLFGSKDGLTFSRYLWKDSGPFATEQIVDIQGPKGIIKNFRVLGPCRKTTYAELFVSDCVKLGLKGDVPVQHNGDTLDNAAEITIIGPKGSITGKYGIITQRHIHAGPNILEEKGLTPGIEVSVQVNGKRGLVFNNVVLVKAARDNVMMMHVDMEEGNAAGIKNGDVLKILNL